ncbi:hypothetical protein D4764_13G0002310 [Takifugu flavidus]|uniref:Uncharacterized protein n=1 Tax=Takifugu flavidus TaxID=433684 RepID=A0A5C6P9G0_9TELE|nr:hypothetical protein D4764_13G0002310 [Takifugu flavidus]
MQNRHLLFIRLLPSPTLSSFFNQEPLVPSVLPTGDASTVPRGGQRPCQIIGVEARSEGAILGDVAATPKMAGLAYEASVPTIVGAGSAVSRGWGQGGKDPPD